MSRLVRAVSLAVLVGAVLALDVSPSAAQITINEARQQGPGSEVTVEGTVTRAYGDFVRLQDDSGPTRASALVVRQTSGAFYEDVQDRTITRGTELQVSGTLSDFNGLLQINEDDLSGYTVQGDGRVPDPQNVTLSEIKTNGEDYESELVRVEDIQFQDASGTFDNQTSYTVTDGGETLTYRVQGTDETNFGGQPIPSGSFDYVGVTGEFQGEYQLLPIRSTTTSFRFGRLYTAVQEGSGAVSVDVQAVNVDSGSTDSVTVAVGAGSTAENGVDVAGFESPQTLTFSGSDPSPASLTLEPVDDNQKEGVERLELTLQSSDGAVAAPRTFTLWLLDDATAQGPVAEGQDGDALIDQLRQTYGDPPTLGYDVARDTMFAAVYGARDDSLRGVYTDFAKYIPAGADPTIAACNDDPGSCTDPNDINTEHAWPQSLGAGEEPARSNMHILFPARADVNTARSNNPFGEIPDAETNQWFVRDRTQTEAPPQDTRPRWSEAISTRFEPRHNVKGDIARSLFYFLTVYPNRADQSFFKTQRETLLDWHRQDPVDAAEMRRNIRQASYQGNKLNPFVVDSSLADRAYGSGADAGVPTNLTATSGADAISLSWVASSGVAEGYHVYRATSSFERVEEGTRLTDSPVSETAYTDTTGELGDQYVYAVTAVEPDGEETALSDRVTGVFYPSTLSATVERSFGDPSTGDSYRLVALPGQVDRGLAQTLEGEVGVNWQAYWDNGQSEDFFVRFEESDQFAFRPGRGFWLLSDADWQVELSVETVPLSGNGAATIPLHEGWNIVSNPLDVDVAWSAVQASNDGSLQTLWGWDGGYSEADVFASARSGTAYYFFNNQGLDALRIPYPSTNKKRATGEEAPTMTLAVRADGAQASSVAVGARSEARDGTDPYDQVAPPGRFAEASLYLAGPGDGTGRARRFAREMRSPDADGHTFDLVLTTEPESTVELRADGVEALGATAALVNPETGRRYDVAERSIELQPPSKRTPLRLIVGTPTYVDQNADKVRPDELRLRAPFPNPVPDQATVSYALPEAADVRLAVYDVLGRRVAVLDKGRREPGVHRLTWTTGQAASGVYLLRLSADGQRRTRKVMHVE